MSILTVFSMNISAIVLAIAGVFGIGEGGGASILGHLHQKMKEL